MPDDSPIQHLGEQNAFLLSGAGFAYVLAVEPGGGVRHVHWGGPVAPSDVATLLAEDAGDFGSNTWSSPRAHAEEFVQHGGRRFDESALGVEFADGVRALDLAYADHTIGPGRDTLAVRLEDRHYPFATELHYRVRGGALERWCEVINDGDEPLVLDRAYSAGWALPWQPSWAATWLAGMYAAETQVVRRPLGPGRLVLESRRGIPGHAAQPWLALDRAAGDDAGEVWSVALAWSGSWRLAAELAYDGRLHVTAGVNDFDLRHPLAPGASWTTPVSVGVFAGAGHDDLTDRWHAYERRHVVPRSGTVRPVLYNSWEATFFDVRPDSQLELARRAAGLGAELFVVDDGWFAGRNDESAGIGDWTPDPEAFPDGLTPLADEVHGLGMRFGLWVEPEAVSPDSALFRAHPDWIYQWPTRPRTLARQTHLLALSRPDVRTHLVEALDALLSSAPIDALKWDLNRPLTEASDGLDESGSVWIGHVEGFYDVLDRVRALHPDVWIESCASGGGRADLGVLSRTEWVWPSDNTDALERLSIQHGYAYVHSPHTMMAWVTDSPTYLTKRDIPLRFRFHSAMTGLLGIGGDLVSWSSSDLAEAAQYVAQYKRVRATVQYGVMRRLSGAPDDVTAVSYLSPSGHQLMVFAFAPSVRHLRRTVLLRLRGLDPAAVYVDTASGTRYSGALLMHHGLRVPLVGDYASELVVLDME
ncbi:alpha-galactosidase [Jiangella alkaliphila]|uniref:Alpha-galactosidase n=1 Tax=Jiangella alkaliphila TaxID=419479 RepID=A0A1H2JS79_9ACTN|nr:alpha-galactosidase [Jiangella alkaliphila]SDU59133.1 alpha-galactosidase [Jiangella alkaliphila]